FPLKEDQSLPEITYHCSSSLSPSFTTLVIFTAILLLEVPISPIYLTLVPILIFIPLFSLLSNLITSPFCKFIISLTLTKAEPNSAFNSTFAFKILFLICVIWFWDNSFLLEENQYLVCNLSKIGSNNK